VSVQLQVTRTPVTCTRAALLQSTLKEAAKLDSSITAASRFELWRCHGAELNAERELALIGPVGERSRLVREDSAR
jgi:hypothetical protein